MSECVFDQGSLQECSKCGLPMRVHSTKGECPPPFGNPKGPYGPADPEQEKIKQRREPEKVPLDDPWHSQR